MKIDNINVIMNQVNSMNTKNDKDNLANNFTEVLKNSDCKDEFINELYDKDDNEEELIIKLIEILLKENFEVIKIDNEKEYSVDFIEIVQTELGNNTNKILSRKDIEEYFQGNDTKVQEIITHLENIKNNNGIKDVGKILDKLKERLLITNENYANHSLNDNEYSGKKTEISFESISSAKYFDEINNMSNSNIKDINRLNIEDNLTISVDKDIDILRSIAKEDSSNLMIYDNKTIITNEISLSNSMNDRPLEITTSNITYDIVESINYMKDSDIQELRVNINPKDLGEISIKLIKSSKDTKLSLVVSKEEVYSLVNKNILEITKHLETLDIKINDVSIEIKSDNQNFFSDNLNQQFKEQQNQHKKNKNNDKSILEIEEANLESEDNINLLA